jgi:hypothetical protein
VVVVVAAAVVVVAPATTAIKLKSITNQSVTVR